MVYFLFMLSLILSYLIVPFNYCRKGRNVFGISNVNQASKVSELWKVLEERTESELKQTDYLSAKLVKHRFHDIRCPKKTAISVQNLYLHANYVGNSDQPKFIASQAPLKEEVSLFWKASMQEKVPVIFDLTTEKDCGLEPYHPINLNESVYLEGLKWITLTKVEGDIHTYRIGNIFSTTTIQRCHYKDWKDFSAISVDSLKTLIEKVQPYSNSKFPIWVHCRAGVGRTGTLITAITLKEKIQQGKITKENLDKKLIDLILGFRKQRGPSFVQQQAQFDLLYKYAQSLLN
jgi:protein tyrosine phosphatase